MFNADVVGSLTDNTTVDYIDTAVKPPHVVVSIDKKALDIPTGMLEKPTGVNCRLDIILLWRQVILIQYTMCHIIHRQKFCL